MTVAAAAWKRMSPEARAKAVALLRLNPDSDALLKGVSPQNADAGLFLKAATWSDEIKAIYEDKSNVPPHKPTDAQNIGYSDCLQHRYWHFKDLPFSRDGTALHEPEVPNAASEIRLMVAALSDPQTPDEVKSYDLSWLLHIVGDIHQPLHATMRFTQSDPGGDGGGNGVLFCVPGKPCTKKEKRFSNLHLFWDGALGNSESVNSALSLACLGPAGSSGHCLPEPDPAAAAVTDPDQWAEESFELAKKIAYRPPVRGAEGPYYVTDAYRARAGSTAEKQVALAGARLAGLLEAALATGVTGPVASPPLASASACPRIAATPS